MLIFTYCSCKSSHYGYQYCYFTSNCSDNKLSFLSSELSECNAISKEFIKWCENISGWQLVLRKSQTKEKYLLMVGQLEKSRELKKKIQKTNGNLNFDENSLDSDYYMTLGFLGSSQEIKGLTFFMMREFKKDGFQSLFNRLEDTIRKTDDATRYEINTKSFNSIFADLPDVSSPQNVSLKPNTLISKMINKVSTYKDTYLSKALSKGIPKYEKRKNFDKCINMISDIDNLPGMTPLLIAYDYFRADTRINIRIDYEYLWNY